MTMTICTNPVRRRFKCVYLTERRFFYRKIPKSADDKEYLILNIRSIME